VVAAIGGSAVLAGTGVIGGGVHPERFDAKTIVARPDGDGIRITEFVDIDFGSQDRRGYERLVPNDFGLPTDVSASTPDANDTLSVVDMGGYTRIRIGDPNVTFTGQHRYELEYVLPDARFDELGLALDIVSPPGGVYPGDAETERFEVVVTGVELRNPRCDVGGLRAEGGCDLARTEDDPPVYRAVLEPLDEDAGLTVGGAIVAFTDPVEIAAPPIPERRSEPNGALIGLGVAGLGVVGSLPVYRWARRRGSNEVYSGGAAQAAYGDLPAPSLAGGVPAPPPVHLVPDDELGDLATIEFVPPKGIEPWEAQVLLTEKIGDSTVEAFLSGLAGKEAIEFEEAADDLVIRSGSKRDQLDGQEAMLIDGILSIDDPYVTGKYDQQFASAWKRIRDAQERQIAASGWWRHMAPGASLNPKRSGSPFGLIVGGVFLFFWFGSAATAFLGFLKSWPAMVLFGLLFPAIVAYFVYRTLLPARSAIGSALALRSESFRRFLHASEGQHVEWAWSQGVLREYSAWAVALGEADAWSRALAAAKVPATAAAMSTPIIIGHHGSSLRGARTAPSSSGGSGFGGGGGGFGGGGVGGGGGGGSSGSW
jgi:uncharacterized membrane protein YgcG